MTDSPAIRLRDIVKSFGPVQANRGAELEVARGEIHALVGENGAGKSTLMRVLAGMYAADSGSMEVEGRDVTGWSTADAIAAGVGMVHQHFMLVPTLTVAENVMLGSELTRGPVLDRAAAEEAVRRLSAETGLVVRHYLLPLGSNGHDGDSEVVSDVLLSLFLGNGWIGVGADVPHDGFVELVVLCLQLPVQAE